MPVTKKRKTKRNKEDSSPLDLYEAHGFLRTTTKSGQHIGACPFCDHDDHFYINKDDGRFSCKSCGLEGNKYSFLQQIYESCLQSTRDKHWKQIAKQRQDLPWQIYREAGIAYDNLQKCYLFPVWNDKGSLVNLYKWSGKRGDNLYSTATCKLHLLGIHAIEEHGPIYLVEGHWDYLALGWLLEKEHDGPYTVLAIPGASNFNEERDVKFFIDREVYVLFDNDDPGRKGQEKVIEILHRHPLASLRCVQWPESYKDGFDLEDLIAEDVSHPRKALSKLKKFIHSVTQIAEDEEEIEPIETFRDVVKEYKKHMHLSKELEDALALMFAVCFSVREESIPLWMFFVGPPGTGKTLLLQSIGQTHRTHFESSLGPKTLVSGQKGDYDPSLLPRLIGRTLVVKDWTELLTMSAQDQEQVISVLRGAYDGRYEKTYGNGMVRVYPSPDSSHRTCYFSLIAGVTHSIYKNDRSDYGERFLRFEIKPDKVEDHIRRALSNVREKVYPEFALRPIANAFLARKVDPENLPTLPKFMESRLVGLSTIISFIRSRVERHQGRLIYRPVLETPTRLAMQLLRLSRFLAFVYNKPAVDDQCYRLVKKVAMDTCYGWHRDAFLTLMQHTKGGIELDDIINKAQIEKTQAHRCMNDLLNLGAAHRKKMNEKQRRKTGHDGKGNIPYLWTLSEQAQRAVTLAKLA
jgi:hypothetical protein